LASVDTPGQHSIAQVSAFLGVPASRTAKTLIVEGPEPGTVIALVLRGDHELNAIKAEKLPGVASPLRLAGDEAVRSATGCLPGSVGPVGLAIPVVVDRAAAALLDEHWNRAFPDPQLTACYPPQLAAMIEPYVRGGDMARICRPIDWFGLNHYGPIFARADPNWLWGFAWGNAPDDAPKSDIGWPIFPDAFRDELVDLTQRFRLPVYVTENGAGGSDKPDRNGKVRDPKRVKYLEAYVAALQEAIRSGADVRGYFVWSLLDNFEWGSGFANRFGLVYVDYATQQRIPKTSYGWYADLIRGARTPTRKA